MPRNIYPPVLSHAIPNVQINKALIGYILLLRHFLKVANHIFTKSNGDGLFQLGGVRILSRFHLGKVAFRLHQRRLHNTYVHFWLLYEQK